MKRKKITWLSAMFMALTLVGQPITAGAQELDMDISAESVESEENFSDDTVETPEASQIEEPEENSEDSTEPAAVEDLEITDDISAEETEKATEEVTMDSEEQSELEVQSQEVQKSAVNSDFQAQDPNFSTDAADARIWADNNTQETAAFISVNSEYTDYLREYNDVRWYKFSVDNPGYISLNFTHDFIDSYSDYWKAFLYNENKYMTEYYYQGNKTVATGGNIGIPAGTYYIKIENSSYSAVDYQIKVNYTSSANWEKEFNETYNSADAISMNRSYYGSLMSYDDVDWYKFKISSPGRISLNFSHDYIESNSDYWKCFLYNSQMACLTTYYYQGDKTSITGGNIGVPSGTYYIKIEHSSYSEVNYRIKVNYTSSTSWEKEFNDTYNSANSITMNTTCYGSIMEYDDVDWYKVYVPKSGNVSLKFTHEYVESYSDCWHVYLYNAGFSCLQEYDFQGSVTSVTTPKIRLSSGNYYIKIEPRNHSDVNYSLKVIPPHTHSYKNIITKATPTSNGKIVKKCSCGATNGSSVIYAANKISLSATSYTYNGKVRKPGVTVKGKNGAVIKASCYTVSYGSGRKNVGSYPVEITFKGSYYKGSVTKQFVIRPASTSITGVSSMSKGFRIKWKKQSVQTNGYQIQYSKKSNFSNASSVIIGKNKEVSRTCKGLSGRCKYYIRIRTYRKINGKTYYSAWSAVKTTTIKK